MADATFSPKLPGEQIFLNVDFSERLNGATIVSALVTATVYNGISDPHPSYIFGNITPTIQGAVVSQKVTGGLAKASYLLSFQATASDGAVHFVQVVLPVIAQRLG